MIKSLIKLRELVKKLWFYHILIGSIFLIFSIKVIIDKGIETKELVRYLGLFFLLNGIGSLLYSFGRVGKKQFHWGEVFFWGVLEMFTGFLILKENLIIEKTLLMEITSTIEKISSVEINLEGYFVIFYIGTFMIFRGLSNIVTKLYSLSISENHLEILSVKRLVVLAGMEDFVFGIIIVICMYVLPELFPYVVFFYILFSSMTMILFGLGLKYSINEEKLINKGVA